MADASERKRLIDFVNQLLYETPGGTRFTQDSPVLTNVWLEYAKAPRNQQKLILTLSRDKNAGEAAHELRKMLGRLREREKEGMYRLPVPWAKEGRRRARISYIPGQISAELYFDEMMRIVLPLTPWWMGTYSALLRLQRGVGEAGGGADWVGFPMDSEDRIKDTVDGLLLMRREIIEEEGGDDGAEPRISEARRKYLRQIPVDYLWLVRLAGLISNAFLHDHRLLDDSDQLGRTLEKDFEARAGMRAFDGTWIGQSSDHIVPQPTREEIEENRRRISAAFSRIYQNWSDDNGQPERSYIWRVTKNRPVELAVAKSALTVKADAARRLFDISCRGITWAIIDSGIDGTHPAFRDTTDAHEREIRERLAEAAEGEDGSRGGGIALDRLGSRVRMTLDFTHLRELLDFDVLGAAEDGGAVGAERSRLLDGLAKRMRKHGQKLSEACKDAEDMLDRLRDRIKRQRDVDWQDLEPLIVDKNPIEPKNDHGTHVAGILAADWIDEGYEDLPLRVRPRVMQGICPDINLIDVRVFREDGKTDEFELLAAIQFLRWMNSRAGYMVVHGANLSLSLIHEVRRFACGQTPICEECNEASALGMVIVAAAGNRGFEANDMNHLTMADGFRDATITDPGNAEHVITVGATHRKRPHEYGVSYFSSRGPTGDGRVKPDLVAPGEKIKGPTPDGGAEFKDGTSMAAPHVSGGAAMLMARHPELVGNPARIKQILCDTATDLHRERYYQGHGLLDILRALQSV